jgi:hypothetical protein
MNMKFRTGAQEAEKAAEKAKGGSFTTVEYFSIKEGEYPNNTVDIRLLTEVDGWITVAQHPSLPTRQQPEGYKGKWPAFMTGVCRKDEHDGERTFPQFSDCWGCDVYRDKDGKPAKKQDRTWGLGILREEYRLPTGQMALRDKMREVSFERDGQTVTETRPHYVVFNMAWSNFWSPIKAVADMKGTCLDRDFRVRRTGFTMNDTDYQIAPHDPMQVTMPDGSMRNLDFRDPEILAFYPDIPDLGEFIFERASDRHYDRFFDTRHPQPTFGKEGDANAAPGQGQPAAPSNDVDPNRAAALAERLQGTLGGTAAAQAPAAPPAIGYGPQAGSAAPPIGGTQA